MAIRWFAQQRQDFIKEHIQKHSSINRSDITEKFGVTLTVASKDLGYFQEQNPGSLHYDTREKIYRKIKKGIK